MRWRGDRQSSNVEDRSGGGRPVGKIATGGGIGVFLIAVIVFFLSGGDLSTVTDTLGGGVTPATYETENVSSKEYTEQKEFAAVVFAHLEDYWNGEFEELNEAYQNPKLVLFTDSVNYWLLPLVCNLSSVAAKSSLLGFLPLMARAKTYSCSLIFARMRSPSFSLTWIISASLSFSGAFSSGTSTSVILQYFDKRFVYSEIP